MRIKPCHGCPLSKGCEQRETFRAAAKGTGAASITFRCPILSREVREGRRVLIHVKMVASGESWDDTAVYTGVARATILYAKADHSFSSAIDLDNFTPDEWADFREHARDPERLHFRRTAKHSRIAAFLDEPDAVACKNLRYAVECANTPECPCSPRIESSQP